ncbi:MAG: PAS domain S-box protein, partial [Bacteroidales bacterium]
IWTYLWLSLSFLAVIIIIASLVLYFQYTTLHKEKSEELATLFRLKEKQLLDWRSERISDALFHKNNVDLLNLIQSLNTESLTEEKISKLADYANSVISTGHYNSLMVLNNEGEAIFFHPASSVPIPDMFYLMPVLYSAGNSGEIIFTKLDITPDSQMLFHVVAPLYLKSENELIGYLVLNLDPAREFYPLLQTFQIKSKSAEALLVQREGDSILFLNELRHVKGTSSRLKISDRLKEIAAVKAVQGEKGVTDALDYRNKKVMAAFGPVTGTDWFLVVKLDKSELFTNLKRYIYYTVLLTLLLVTVIFLIVRIVWLRRDGKFEKHKLELEYENKLINLKYHLVTQYANDAIIIWDSGHKLVDVNDRAIDLYGYTRDEMLNLKKDQLRPLKNRDNVENSIALLQEDNSARYETEHVRKNGDIFSVELSTRGFNIDNKVYYLSIIRDITERKKAGENLIRSEERLRLALKGARQGLWDIDILTGDTLVTPEYETMLGYAPGELNETNEKWLERMHPEDREAVYQVYLDYIHEKLGTYSVEFRQKTKTGEWKWILSQGEIVSHDSNGKPIRMLGTHTDITERKIMEETLRKNQKLLNEMGKIAEVGGWEFDVETHKGTWTEEVARIHELPPDEETDVNKGLEFYKEESRALVEQAIQKAISAGKTYDLQLEMVTRNNNHKWVRTIGIPEIINGKVVRVSGSFQDITKIKTAQLALKESEERYRSLLEQSPVGIAVHVQGIVQFVNRAGVKILGGESPWQIIGNSLKDIIHPDYLDNALKRIEQLLAGKDNLYPVEDVYIRLDGIPVDVEVMATPVTYRGQPAIQVIITDITERKKIQDDIKRMNAELEQRVKERTAQLAEINRELETFTYSVSHDLKAPLRGIDGYSRILLDDYSKILDDEGRRYLENVRESAMQMNDLIDDLLNYSRLERYTLRPVNIDLSVLISTILQSLQKSTMHNNVSITNSVPPLKITADSNGLTIALRNLIENAVKFTGNVPKPAIKIALSEKPESCIISVHDNGIGIDVQYHQRIFEIFQRLHRIEEYPGTGIGLAMVKKSMERMGGKVWVESSPGKGSAFYLEIPKI